MNNNPSCARTCNLCDMIVDENGTDLVCSGKCFDRTKKVDLLMPCRKPSAKVAPAARALTIISAQQQS